MKYLFMVVKNRVILLVGKFLIMFFENDIGLEWLFIMLYYFSW